MVNSAQKLKEIVIRDEIHDYVRLVTQQEQDIIHTRLFQRLRRISQNALASYTYPAVRGSRFEHSLGVMHIAGEMVRAALRQKDTHTNHFRAKCAEEFKRVANSDLKGEIDDQIYQLIRLVALLHDIGHLPFSHAGEDGVGPYAKLVLVDKADAEEYLQEPPDKRLKYHEFATKKLIERDDVLNGILGDFKPLVLQVLNASKTDLPSVFLTLKRIINADIDADRGDYILRDGSNVGKEFGQYDISRIIDSMRVFEDKQPGRFHILPTGSSLSVLERFLAERYNLHKWVYFHHHVRFSAAAISRLLSLLLIGSRNWPEDLVRYLNDEVGRLYFRKYIDEDSVSDDYWLWVVFHNVFRQLKQLDYRSDERMNEAFQLLRYLLFREKIATPLWKDNLEFALFSNEFYTPLNQALSEKDPEYGTEQFARGKNYVGEGLERACGNLILEGATHEVLIEIQHAVNDDLDADFGKKRYRLLLASNLPFDVFKDRLGILLWKRMTQTYDPVTIANASPYLRTIHSAHFGDAHFYAYIIDLESTVELGSEVIGRARRALITASLRLLDTKNMLSDAAIQGWKKSASELRQV